MLSKRFAQLPYKWKIRYVIAVAVTLAVMMMGLIFGIYDYRVQKQGMIMEMSAISGVVARRSSAVVSFEDRERATENLTGTILTGKVYYACIMNTVQPSRRLVLGEIPAPGYECIRQLEGRAAAEYVGNKLILENAIELNGLTIGFLKMVIDTDELSQRVAGLVVALAISAFGSVILAFVVTNRYQHSLYDPIVDLGDVAHHITKDRDYQIRAKKTSDDEIGTTVEAFNTMLEMLEDDKNQLERMAYYDALTKLPNRRLFMEKLARAVAHSRLQAKPFGVIFIDLDNFKWVNDNLGHDMGDLLLKVISKRTASAIRDIDTVARLGGDEFTVILLELDSLSEAEAVCQRILDALKPEIQLREHSHKAGASLGLAIGHGETETVDSIIKKADLAVYDAKDAGKNCFRVYKENDRTDT
jgi:diguanylate cyclase (GGDEF)-like protein